jgi:hypothetical protein
MKNLYFLNTINSSNNNFDQLDAPVQKGIGKRSFLFITFISILSMTSCYKDSTTFTATPGASFLNNALIEGIRPTMLTTIMPDATQAFTLTTTHGTTITVPSNAFLQKDNTAPSGQIEIRYFEVFTKGEMILYGTPTISEGRLLNSAGAYLIKAFNAKGDELKLNAAANKALEYNIPVVKTAADDMRLFVGGELDTAKYRFNWADFEASQVVTTLTPAQEKVYHFFSPTMEWINCDRFWDFTDKGNVTVGISGNGAYDMSNTVGYIVFKNQNTTARLQWVNKTLQIRDMPVGEEAKIVLLTQRSKTQYEMIEKDFTVEVASTFTLQPETSDIEKIKTFLATLK